MTAHNLRAIVAIPVYLMSGILLCLAAVPLAASAAVTRLALAIQGRAAPPDLFRSWPFPRGPRVNPTPPPRKERLHGR